MQSLCMLFRPFMAGDFAKGVGTFGNADEINVFTTEMSAFVAQKTVFPKSGICGQKITSHSDNPVRGVEIPFLQRAVHLQK
jgi:hypothetical protein